MRRPRARGGIPADAPAKRMGLINGVVGLENVKDADLVIEAVFETMAVKKEVFGALDKFAKPGAVLASNTSYLNIDEIAKETKRPQDVLGMHFFSPANVMKLCEIVRAAKTAPDALTTAVSIARKIAKVPAVVGVCDGFVGNRMLAQRGKQSEKLLVRRRAAAAGRRCRDQSSACRWDRSRWAISPASISAGARARTAASSRDRRRAVRSRPLRPEDRQGLLQVRRRLARGAARSRSREADRRDPAAARPQAAAWSATRKSSSA